MTVKATQTRRFSKNISQQPCDPVLLSCTFYIREIKPYISKVS